MAADTPTEITTYHCICAQLSCALFGSSLSSSPKRKQDNAAICAVIPSDSGNVTPAPGTVVLSSDSLVDGEATVLKLEDGFEKRYFVRCGRCGLRWGYFLDEASFEDGKGEHGRRGSVVFLLEGGLLETAKLREGKDLNQVAGRAEVGAVS